MPVKHKKTFIAALITKTDKEEFQKIARRNRRSVSSMLSLLIKERIESEANDGAKNS